MDQQSASSGPLVQGLVVDWGGVLTSNLHDSMQLWANNEQVDLDAFGRVMRQWLGPQGASEAAINPVHALERGEIEVPHFERHLAEGLTEQMGREFEADGLLTRLFEGFSHAEDMNALVRRTKTAGFRTGMLSNSWGNTYPDHLFDGMFDVVVISGDVGMRKPEERIYSYTQGLMELEPHELVFVDDLMHNVEAARDFGMVGIHHVSYEQTASEIDILFGEQLSS